jgi:hypothetical protein
VTKNKSKSHLGWTNYETWCVSQWLPEEHATWEAFREQMRHQLAQQTASRGQHPLPAVAARSTAKYCLASQLREAVEGLGYTDLPGVYCDLLHAAVARVNWPEVVEHFLVNPFPHIASLVEAAGPEPCQLFEAGEVITAPAAKTVLTATIVESSVARHVRGDWGLLDALDRRQNLRALAARRPVQSVYELENGTPFWVITDGERTSTCILVAKDY